MLESVYLMTTPFACLSHPFKKFSVVLLSTDLIKKKSEAKAAQFVNAFHLGCLTSLKGIFAGFYRLNF